MASAEWQDDGARAVRDVLAARLLLITFTSFLDKMRKETTDKIVLISNYTETLDVIERLLDAKRSATSSPQIPSD